MVSGILATLIVGLIIGFIANTLMGSGGMGILWCIVLGLVGSLAGGFLLSVLGLTAYGLVGHVVIGVIGACIVIALARRFIRPA